MSTHTDPPPTFTFELPINAKPAQVWNAISDGDALQRWFPIAARIKPGVGGSIFLSWGPTCEGEAPITIWEPGKCLGWKEQHGGGVEISAMFQIEPASGGDAAIIRVTQSGFGRGAQWNDMYDSISSGWKFEFRSLRHYLQHHAGRDRACVWLPVPGKGRSQQEAWERLTGPGALCRSGSIGGHIEGHSYSLIGPDGHTYSGTVERAVPNRVFAGTVRELDNALMRIELEPRGTTESGACAASPTFWLSKWGGTSDEVAAVGNIWADRMAALL